MIKTFRWTLVFFAAVFLAGCATTKKILPLHDEMLVYELPYDLTYLRTLDALDLQKGWQLKETDKEKGLITIRNVDYQRLDDSDKRELTFVVKRVDRAHTSVQLVPNSQRTLSGGDMLKAIGEKLGAELK